MNIVLSNPKTGKAYSKKIEEPIVFLNKKIGDEVKLDSIGLEGFTARIMGGSDKQGTPMHPTISGSLRKKIFSNKGVGFRTERKGERRRKNIRGNTVSKEIEQLNLKIITEGKKNLDEIFRKEEKKEEPKESVKEQMIKESLESVGKEGLGEEAKKIKGKVKGQ